MKQTVVLITEDTRKLIEDADRVFPDFFVENIVDAMKRECRKRSLDFLCDTCGGWRPYDIEVAANPIYFAISPFESINKIAFMQARDLAGKKRFNLLWNGYLTSYHPAFASIWSYLNAYEQIFTPIPFELSSFYSPFEVTGLESASEGALVVVNDGFLAPFGLGKAKLSKETKIAILLEPSAQNGLSATWGALSLQNKGYSIKCAVLKSPMACYNSNIEKEEEETLSMLDMFDIDNSLIDEILEEADIVVQTVPYSPRQMFYLSQAVSFGCTPIFFDPIGLYGGEGLYGYTRPYNLEKTVEEARESLSAGEDRLPYAHKFFNSYIQEIFDHLGLIGSEDRGLIQ